MGLDFERLYELSNGNYLFIQSSCDGGYDYEYRNGDTRMEIDGGQFNSDADNEDALVNECLYILDISDVSYGLSDLDYWEDFA